MSTNKSQILQDDICPKRKGIIKGRRKLIYSRECKRYLHTTTLLVWKKDGDDYDETSVP